MAWMRNYLELKVGSTTLRFRMLHEGSNMRGVAQNSTFQRDLDNRLVAVRATLQPRMIHGFLLFKDTEASPYGTMDELAAWWNSDSLEARGMADASFWDAAIVSEYAPQPIDMMDYYRAVEIRIEQVA